MRADTRVIGLFFFNDIIKSNSFLDMLENDAAAATTATTLFFNWMVHQFSMLKLSVTVLTPTSQVSGQGKEDQLCDSLVLLILCI